MVVITRRADLSVRGDLSDRLENLSSLAGGDHEHGCSCHLEACPQRHSSKEGGFSNPPLSFAPLCFGCATQGGMVAPILTVYG